MKKLLLTALALIPAMTFAAKFTSPGNGTTFTLQSLSEIDSCSITLESPGVYVMAEDVTIAANDAFKMDNGVTLKMGGTTTFRIEGKSDFSCADSTTVTRNVEGDLPKGFYLANTAVDTVYFKNMHFQYAGVRTWMTDSYVELDNCSFMYNNGKNSSSGALSLAKDGTCFKVTNCKFIANEVPAIGGASNMANGILIENCYFEDNNTKNANKPQLNLTVGGDNDVIIRNNVLKGAKRLKVGAIAVSNLMGLPGKNNVIIEGNYMDNHRYGITTNGPLKVRIIDNQIIDNNHESNPANGGSCISLYDSKYNQEAYIKGNRLEGGLWGITVIGGKSVNVGKTANPSSPDYNPGQNVFVNNGNGGKLYDIYNNGTNAVYAQGNTWNVSVQTPDSIEKVISHIVDNPALGRVIFTEKKAAKFVSPGNGTTYTLKSLSEIDTCGIILENNGVYAMTHDIEITPKDTFAMESGVTLKMGHGVQFYAEGAVQMNCADQSTVTRDGNDVPYGFYVATENPVDTMFINNVKFDYAGLRTHYVGKAKITNCEFNNNNGKSSSQGALALGPSDGDYIVDNCKFVGNSVPAIGVAANYLLGLDIEDCYFEDNNTSNTNKPFVNITIGGEHDVIIRNSEFVGAQRTMVGGIAVSNMLSAAGKNNVIIEGNKLTGLRYGVTLTSGPMNAVIKDNELVDNKYDTNPMNGGSGISLYDPYGYQNVMIEGNTITDNFWGITVIGGGNVNIGKTANPDAEDYNPGNNVFNNNGNGGQLYDLYNNGTKTIYAQGNTWGVDEQTAEKIESVIFHKADNESLGLVIYMPEENAVEEIEVDDNTPAVYYNIQGVKVNNPTNGLYIKVQGNKATKVVL